MFLDWNHLAPQSTSTANARLLDHAPLATHMLQLVRHWSAVGCPGNQQGKWQRRGYPRWLPFVSLTTRNLTFWKLAQSPVQAGPSRPPACRERRVRTFAIIRDSTRQCGERDQGTPSGRHSPAQRSDFADQDHAVVPNHVPNYPPPLPSGPGKLTHASHSPTSVDTFPPHIRLFKSSPCSRDPSASVYRPQMVPNISIGLVEMLRERAK